MRLVFFFFFNILFVFSFTPIRCIDEKKLEKLGDAALCAFTTIVITELVRGCVHYLTDDSAARLEYLKQKDANEQQRHEEKQKTKQRELDMQAQLIATRQMQARNTCMQRANKFMEIVQKHYPHDKEMLEKAKNNFKECGDF